MVQDNKEFDKRVKDLLYDAEEEVPAGIMDDVFSRLDNSGRKSVKVLPWLGWTLSGVAVAAAVALFVMLRPSGADGNIEVRQGLTAESAESSESSTAESQQNLLAFADDNSSSSDIRESVEDSVACSDFSECHSKVTSGSSEKSGQTVTSRQSVPTEKELSSDKENTDTPEILQSDENVDSLDSENDSAADALDNESLTTSVSESSEESSTVIASDLTNESVKTASVDDQDSSVGNNDSFAALDEDEHEKSGPKVSLLAGGDISTNNEAKGLSGFGGFRIPSLDAKDVTYVEQVGKSSSYSIPLTFGLGAKVNFTKRWAVGVGVNWTMLRRTFNGRYVKVENGVSKSADTEVQHTLQYIGIPVNAFYNIIESPRIKFYTYAGGTIEKGISNVYKVQDIKNVPSVRNSVKGVQMSAGAGLGVEFIIVDWLGVYVNPGVRYYFDCDQPVNIRTQQPFMMDFEIGLRFEI